MASRKAGKCRVDFSIESDEEGVHGSFHIPTPAEDAEDMKPHPNWRWLSPTTLAIVKLLASTDDWLTREVIASRLGVEADNRFGSLLTDLVERGILESSTRKGYLLALPASEEPKRYRKRVLDWVQQQSSGYGS